MIGKIYHEFPLELWKYLCTLHTKCRHFCILKPKILWLSSFSFSAYIEHSQFNFSFNSYLFDTGVYLRFRFNGLLRAYCQAVIRFAIVMNIVTNLIQWKQTAKNGKNTDFDDEKEDTFIYIFFGKDENLYDYWMQQKTPPRIPIHRQQYTPSTALHGRYEKIMWTHMLNIQMLPLRCT